MKSNQKILTSLQESIQKAKQAVAGIDRSANPAKYRSTLKRLKRAQRNLTKWKRLSARLEERKKGKKKEKGATAGPESPPS